MWDLNKIPIYNEENKSHQLECLKTLEKHEKSLKFLEKIPGGFCSISNDDDIIVWSEEGEFKRSIARIQKEYTHGILCVNNFIIVAGPSSPFLIAYQYDQENKTAKTLGQSDITHKDIVTSLFNISNDRFVTGSKDQTIIVWCSKTLSPLYQQHCKNSINYLFPICSGDFLLATINKGFSIFDTTKGGSTMLEFSPSSKEDSNYIEINGAITLYNNTKILTWAGSRVSVWNWPHEIMYNGNTNSNNNLNSSFNGNQNSGSGQSLSNSFYGAFSLSGSIGNSNNNNNNNNGINSLNSSNSNNNKNKLKLPVRPTFIGDMKGHTESITCVSILSDNSIATGSLDNTIILWKDGKYQSETRTCVANFLLNDFHAKNNVQYIEHYADDQEKIVLIQESYSVDESNFD
ncbi:hypothetical protein DDB_G0288243 [Dictyostelium discoideum AX4]|uniref:Uncharacterized protein n=1 Tax=Dictyostelium discoideum TaxID=44689 RepID=Q54J81_DICDI|nr:hypothetical protein DDB_G0288243 [Dictyostelium discoideum AX4]EAL63352.1 hypothetical protein DDB_G0288243 [Dictyostelium discoideum AX4]|eukprot:XP_636855.1 hypothetical protein DDB_G0288243 [Dictyostelium discoideum AX4]